jgi:NAD(P)-dependent dehydrogenase (short-subunit alcohol dehydrogenase family)
MHSLTGKLILVTGSAKRIGRGIALRLAAEGARVLIHYDRSEAEARQTAEDCRATGLYRANLEHVPDIHRMFAEIAAQHGRLDALVNNAARFTRFDPLDITEADWDFIHNVNLKSVFFTAQAAARQILADPGAAGRIVNISSLGGLRPWAEHAHYCSSKAGVIMLTKALAKAWAPRITVNSVAPGVIPFDDIDERGLKMLANTPAQRGGTPADVADAVVFFLTTSNFVTGQVMAVDGGLSLR